MKKTAIKPGDHVRFVDERDMHGIVFSVVEDQMWQEDVIAFKDQKGHCHTAFSDQLEWVDGYRVINQQGAHWVQHTNDSHSMCLCDGNERGLQNAILIATALVIMEG